MENEQHRLTSCPPAAPARCSGVQDTHSVIDGIILACMEALPNEEKLLGMWDTGNL